MQFKTLRKTLVETEYIIKVVSLDYETDEGEVTIKRHKIDYLRETTEDFAKTVDLLDSLNSLRVKFVGIAGGLLEITLEK